MCPSVLILPDTARRANGVTRYPWNTREGGKKWHGLPVKSVESLRGSATRREIPDSLMQGLYLVVQPGTSHKSWAVRCRRNGRPAKITVGPYPRIGLVEARDSAARILRNVAEGRDPTPRAAGTVEDAVEQFLRTYAQPRYRPSTLRDCERAMASAVTTWRGRQLESITKGDVRSLLADIAAPSASNQTYKLLRRFFSWCVEADILTSSPFAGLKKLHKEKSRERVLTDDELRRVWLAADQIGYPFGVFVKLSILTGQRRSEIAGMRRNELRDGDWTLPGARTKNGRVHLVPLSRQAAELIDQQPPISEQYVFSSFGDKPISGFHNAKATMDRISDATDWTVHDLRRTAASGMAKLGVSLVVIEKVLNHVSGSLAGIVGVYQRHEFAEEKRAALQQWADHVEQLVRQ
jgi:integrase